MRLPAPSVGRRTGPFARPLVLLALLTAGPPAAAQTLTLGISPIPPAPTRVLESTTTTTTTDSTGGVKKEVEQKREVIEVAPDDVLASTVSLLADASTQTGQPSGATTGAGAFGLVANFPRAGFTWTALVNAVASDEVVREGFGTFLLSPRSGSGFSSGLLDAQVRLWPSIARQTPTSFNRWNSLRGGVALHFYGAARNSVWATDTLRITPPAPPKIEPDTAAVTIQDRVVSLAYGATVVFNLVDVRDGQGTPYGIAFEAGVSGRRLVGDIRTNEFLRARKTVLGTARRVFSGLELGMTVTVGPTVFSAQYYSYLPSGVTIKGLTGGQFVVGVGLRGLFTPVRLREPSATPPKTPASGAEGAM